MFAGMMPAGCYSVLRVAWKFRSKIFTTDNEIKKIASVRKIKKKSCIYTRYLINSSMTGISSKQSFAHSETNNNRENKCKLERPEVHE